MADKTAAIRRTKTVKYVAHPCKGCEWNNPPLLFEGKITESGEIEWPMLGNMYRIAYCPFCGGKLLRTYRKVNDGR